MSSIVRPEAPSRPNKRLADALTLLASEARLAILREVRVPKALKEVRVQAVDDDRGRPLARQTIKQHLDKLVEAGLVKARETERAYGATVEYVLNHQALYALSEEFRALASLRPLTHLGGETRDHGGPTDAPALEGPALVLVKGLDEGRVFKPARPSAAEWIIGRSPGVDVFLDFDPFVSSENTVVRREGEGFVVEDLGSRNGTFVNFAPLAPGAVRVLEHGDLVGVGRSLLLFRR